MLSDSTQVYAYQVSQWGACTTSCGGTRTRNVTCVNATASHIEVASSLCASLPKPSTSQPCNTCGFCKNRAEGNPNFNICTGRGECHANEDFCICDANYLGDFCHVSLGCNGVLDGNGECCEGILLADGACCKGESAVQDINGVCCNSGVVDACGVCEGPSLYVDARGECCTTKLDAQGICCAGDLDECGVCDGDGSTCVKRVALTFTLPASIPDGADLATITSPSFALLADDVAAFVQARTSTPGSVVERFEATPTARRLRLARRLAGYSVDAQVQLAQSISDTSVLVGTSGDITVVAVSALPAAGLCGNGVCELGEQCDAADTTKACCPDDCPLRQVCTYCRPPCPSVRRVSKLCMYSPAFGLCCSVPCGPWWRVQRLRQVCVLGRREWRVRVLPRDGIHRVGLLDLCRRLLPPDRVCKRVLPPRGGNVHGWHPERPRNWH